MNEISIKGLKEKGALTYDPDDRAKFEAQMRFISDGPVKVTITPYNENAEKQRLRTLAQNKYYHKILDILCEYTGDTHMDMHDQLKVRFLARPYVLGDREYMIVKSTTELNTKNFTEYLEKIFHWAAEELQVTLPSASDYY